MKSPLARATASALFLGAALASSALAQGGAAQDPLVRLGPYVRNKIELLFDSARLIGVPTKLLQSKALEGISKGVDDRRILQAVRAEFGALRDAKAVLGPRAQGDELSAAASALRVGLKPTELADLARVRREKQLTVPLVVLADLISRGVPRDTASSTISQLWHGGAADDDFYGLWRGVERDIDSGTDPGVALMNRAREIPARAQPPASPPATPARPDFLETANP